MPNLTPFKGILRRNAKSEKQRHTIAVHFKDMSSENGNSNVDFCGCHSDSCPSDLDNNIVDSANVTFMSRCENCNDPAIDVSIHHLDDLGHALEHTFKEVDSIDACVARLRDDFDHDRVSEHRFMTGMCSAKIMRDACCKQQLDKWQQFRQGIQDLLARIREVDSVSTDSQGENDDISVLLCHLGKVPIVGTVFRRLDPAKDARAFVEQWVFSGA
ncbi:uncharacterized protein LOC112571678 [Pomacea canaliculata]|uniref:uncharacterized protein LOC112571678 n=1 Tax=Pomacea canaliculata TaxID=400727 RepID=UPI000D730100|nr:uncharacterized protein LOC112571678 [Pomacea canaliculata]XP_025106652.1 uncharacterized protein LOC112571678 [Pomacea canaliculata]XP_025106654.1 uncharacterized protein LOC112571678 [Pomacea canaliculata]XP_025106655.1 uncharacterized protein LOC112571678 [Pomacea canaliculata]